MAAQPSLRAQGTWSLAAPLPAPARLGHVAATLNGIVHVVGGSADAACSALTTHEAFDPVANTWTSHAAMNTHRTHAGAAVLNNGAKDLLYVVGGSTGCSTRTATLEAYDPDTNTWSFKASMPGGYRSNMGVAVLNGRMYVAGGIKEDTPSGVTTLVEAYDPVANTWTAVASLPLPRYAVTIGALNGKLIVGGGSGDATTVVYDPATNAWTPGPSMLVARTYAASSVLNGRLYAIGGEAASFFSSVEVYDPVTNSWSFDASLPAPRAAPSSAVAGGGVYVAGGYDGSAFMSTTFVFTAADSTAPTTAATSFPPANGNGWTNSNVLVTLNASDDVSGSGVQSVSYSFVGAQNGSGTVAGNSASFTISSPGTTTITYHAQDNAGNVESNQTLVVNLDKTSPVIGALPNMFVSATSSGGAVVAFIIPASDALSGIAAAITTPLSSGMIFPIGTTHLTASVTDLAGNTTLGGFDVVVTPPPPSAANVSFFGGAGDQRGTGVAVSGGAVYVSGDKQPETQTAGDAAIVARFAIPLGANPVWSRTFASGSQLLGVAATTEGVYAAGMSHSLTNDPVGGKEPKTVLSKFSLDGSAGPGVHGSTWTTGGPGNLGPFFNYSGVEFFQGVTSTTEGGHTYIYAAQGGQPCSFAAYLLAKYDTAGTFIAAATDSTVGISFGGCPFAPNGGSSTPGVVTLNGNVYIAGTTSFAHEGDAPNGRPALYKYTSNLALQGRFRDGGVSGGFTAVTSGGNAIYAVGQTYNGPGTEDYLIEKFDQAGNLLWRHVSGGPNSDALYGVTSIGNRVFAAGYTRSSGAGGSDGVVLEIDAATGNILSTALYGGANDDRFNGIANDGSDLYVVGESRSFPSPGGNAVGSNEGVLVRYSLAFDSAPPVTTATPSPAPNGAGWNNGDVTIALNATDPSGVQSVAYTLNGAQNGSFSTPGNTASVTIFNEGTTTVTYHAVDNQGNVESDHALTVKSDRTAPSLSYPFQITTNATSATGAAVNFVVSANDGLSGLAGPVTVSPLQSGQTFPIGTTHETVTAVDAAGNVATAGFDVIVNPGDTISPATTANFPSPNANGWNRFDVHVSLNAFDSGGAASPSGVQSITYALSGAQTGGGTFIGNNTQFDITNEGTTTVTYHAVDMNGNVEADHVFTVKLDKTVPTATTSNVTVSATSSAGAVVNFNLAPADALSGVNTVIVTPLPSGATFPHGSTNEQVTVTDKAGNSTFRSFTVTVNKALQSISVSPSTETMIAGSDRQFQASGQFTDGSSSMLPSSASGGGGGGGGGSVPSNLAWQLNFTPGLNVSACTSTTASLSSQAIAANNGAVDNTWGQGNIARVTGTLTPTQVDLTIQCNPANGAAGTLSATWTGTRYEGTATFGGTTSHVVITGWSSKAPMLSSRFSLGAATVNGIVYAMGGNPSLPQPVDAYDPATNSWTTVSTMAVSVEGAGVAALNGRIYVAGGHTAGGNSSNILQSYDPAANTWTPLAPMQTARAHLALVTAGGKLYAIGGETGSGSGPPTAVVERYDPATNTWSPRTSMATPRRFLVAGALNSDALIVAAGGGDSSVELYDVAANTWTAGPAMLSSGGSPAGVVVSNALHVFGIGSNGIGVHLFRPANGSQPAGWAALTSMPTGRGQLAAAAVNDVVYAIGGLLPGGGSTTTAVNEAFSVAPPSNFVVSSGGGGGGGGGGFSLPVVTWQSTNTAVATVNSSGMADGLSAGQTTIVATAAGVSCETTSTCATLTVTPSAKLTLTLAPGSLPVTQVIASVADPGTGQVVNGPFDVPIGVTQQVPPQPFRLVFAAPAGYTVTPGSVDLDLHAGDDINIPLSFGVIDTTPPTVVCGTADGLWHGADVSIACTASDNASGLQNPADASFSLTTIVPVGTETAHAATNSRSICDAKGNCITAGPIAGNMVDKKAPALTVPTNQTAEAMTAAGAIVNFAPATAADQGSGVRSVSCDRAPGALFPLGSTSVHCTAMDNTGNTGSMSFTITVRDSTAPVIRIFSPRPDDAVQPGGSASVQVDVTEAVQTQQVTINGVSAFPIAQTGPLTLRWMATVPVPPGGPFSISVSARDVFSNQGTAFQMLTDNDGIESAIDRHRVTGANESLVFSSDFNFNGTVGTVTRSGGALVSVFRGSGSSVQIGLRSGGVARVNLCTGSDKYLELNAANEGVEVTCSPSGTVTVRNGVGYVELYKQVVATYYTTIQRCYTTGGWFNRHTVCYLEQVPHTYTYYNQIVLPPFQGVSTGSPIVADPANTEPLQVTLLQVDDDGTQVPVADLALDPGESADVAIQPGNQREDRIQISALAGDVTVAIGAVIQTITQGEQPVLPLDNTPPVLALPGNIIKEIATGSSAAVTFAATAIDGLDGATPVICSPASGSTFLMGITTVTCTATDLHGNAASGSFTVTVTVPHKKPPKVKVPGHVKVDVTGSSDAVVTFTATATDPVDGPLPVTCTPPSGSLFPLGDTNVACTATNLGGKSDTETFKVTVRDK